MTVFRSSVQQPLPDRSPGEWWTTMDNFRCPVEDGMSSTVSFKAYGVL